MIMNSKKIAIGIVGILLLVMICLWTLPLLSVCTFAGCFDSLEISLPSKIPSKNLFVIADDFVIVDFCNGKESYPLSRTQQSIIVSPADHKNIVYTSQFPKVTNSELLMKNIGLLEVGYRKTCKEEPTIVYSATNLIIDYEENYPNGKHCDKIPCYHGKLTLE